MKKALVLLSSGLDSTVNLYAAVKKYQVVKVLPFDYGQRAAQREIQKSRQICKLLRLNHQVVKVDLFKDFGKSSLINTKMKVPTKGQVQIGNHRESLKTASGVWVPNRNGVCLNIAAACADAYDVEYVIPGFNKEEAATFPDNSKTYLRHLTKAFQFSTQNQVIAKCFTIDMDKTQIVKWGKKMKIDWNLTWPCYFSGKSRCGQCESCLRAKNAFEKNKILLKNYFASNQ